LLLSIYCFRDSAISRSVNLLSTIPVFIVHFVLVLVILSLYLYFRADYGDSQ
jgi:uncharacterized membrane protein YadS